MRPNATRFEPLEAVGVFAVSVALLFVAGAFVFADLGLAGIVLGQVFFIAGPAVFFATRATGSLRGGARLLGIRTVRIRSLIGAALLGLSFWYLNQTFAWPVAQRYLAGDEVVRALEETMIPEGRPVVLSLLVFACFPAVCEEILLRGAVARGLRPALGIAGAVAVSALLFGLLHVVPAQALVTAIFGIPLGIAALASESLLPSILMHFLNNTSTIVLASGGLPSVTRAIEQEPTVAAISAGLASASGLLLLLWGRPSGGPDSRSS